MRLHIHAIAIAFLLTACATQSPETLQLEARAPSEEDAGRILAHARKVRDTQGCTQAAPAFRVAAAMGEGLEIAQSELSDCLLKAQGASPAENELFRKEAVFWLERAAFAGNGSAQRALAVELGKTQADHSQALKWALSFARNGEARLYGHAALAPAFVQSLRSSLTHKEIEAAENFAVNFSVVRMAPYYGPPQGRIKTRPGSQAPEHERRR